MRLSHHISTISTTTSILGGGLLHLSIMGGTIITTTGIITITTPMGV